jgi:hypothetical protein
MNTAFERAVEQATEWFTPAFGQLDAPLRTRTAYPAKRARFVLDYLGFELRVELRDNAHTPDHYVFWAALASGPLHLHVDTLVDEIVGPGDVPNLAQALNLMRLELMQRKVVNKALRRKLGPFWAGRPG